MIPSTRFCDKCGAANPSQAAYCSFCGQPLHTFRSALYHSETGRLLAGALLKQRFRIVAPLGTGGMGAVYQAEDTQLGNRQIAIKEMSQGSLNFQEQRAAAEAFRHEAVMLARLQHPNLPSIFDHFEENGRCYLVMSFINGETLEEYLNRARGGRLPVSEVVQIGLILCSVLGYLHNQQPPIIFRDLKLPNIMRTPEGHLYLIDFGIARHFKPGQARDTAYFGSMGYAPPEQYGKAQTTPRSDIYSLGAILHQLLSGHDPASTPFRFPPLTGLVPDIPVELASLIARMLEIEEEQRPASVAQVKQELQDVLSPVRAPLFARNATLSAVFAEAHAPVIASRTEPTTPPALTKEQWLEIASEHFKAESYREALAAYDHALQLDSQLAEAYKEKCFALYKLNRYKEALVACEQAIHLKPNDGALYQCKADTLDALGRNREAIGVYEQAIQLEPQNVYSYYRLADVLEALGRREEALQRLEQAIQIAPGDARSYYSKADVLEALGRREEALDTLEQALRLAPASVRAYKTMAILLEALERNEEALSAREQIIQLDPHDSNHFYFKGALLEKLGRDEEALLAYEEALRLDARDDFLYQRKAVVLGKLKRYAEALYAYDQALNLKPDASAYRGKGDMLQALGRPAEAEQAYERATRDEAL